MQFEKTNIDKLILSYNGYVAKLLNICSRFNPNNVDIERIRNLISLVKQTDPLYLLNNSNEKFWDARDMIKERNLEYFSNINSPLFKKHIDDNEEKTCDEKEFIYTLIGFVHADMKKLKSDELDYVWNIVQCMLECNIEYMIYIGNHV
jgi:hypothetical protein